MQVTEWQALSTRAEPQHVSRLIRWLCRVEGRINGVIKVADIEMPCSVLADGTRVLHERGVMKALGVTRSGSIRGTKDASGGGAKLPLFVAQKNLIPYLDEELSEVLKQPIWYRPPSGPNSGRPHKGIRAEMLPKICNGFLPDPDIPPPDSGLLGMDYVW